MRSSYVPRPHASIYGGVQPDLLFRCLNADDVAAGLPARFLFAWPPERSRSWTEAEVPAELLVRLRQTFDRLYSLSLVYEHRNPEESSQEAQQDWRPVTLHLSASAREKYAEWFESMHRASGCAG